MHKRLTKVRETLSLSKTEFAEKISLKSFNIRDMESGKQKISAEIARKIEEIFSISGWWLLTGKGKMNLNTEINIESSENFIESMIEPINIVKVKVYPNVYASAGFGNALSESVHKETVMDKTLLRDMFNVRNFNNLDMIKVMGDSMSPIINDGEVLFIERGNHAKNGDTIVATLNDELYVKRFYKDPFGEWVRLESENQDFPHIELNTPQKISMLNIIGVARSKVKVY